MKLIDFRVLMYKDMLDERGNVKFSRKALEDMDVQTFHGLPVYLVRGAVKIPIGFIHVARRGRDEVFADVLLDIDGSLDLAKDETTGKIRAVSLSFKRKV